MIHQLGDKTVKREGKNWIADSAKVIGDIHLKMIAVFGLELF